MGTATKPARRELEYQTLEEFRDDVERLAAGSFVTVGNWSFAQILRHLSSVMVASLDGFPFQFPWIVRRTGGRVMKWRLLRKPMLPAGFQVPKSAESLMPPDNADLTKELDALRAASERYHKETPIPEHPIFGWMSQEDWNRLHRRHNALHMSFVVPQGTDAENA